VDTGKRGPGVFIKPIGFQLPKKDRLAEPRSRVEITVHAQDLSSGIGISFRTGISQKYVAYKCNRSFVQRQRTHLRAETKFVLGDLQNVHATT